MIKKLLLFALLAAFLSGTTTPTLTKVLGFGPATAHAQDTQGDDDNQGDQNVDEQ